MRKTTKNALYFDIQSRAELKLDVRLTVGYLFDRSRQMKRDVIAIVGGGRGCRALLAMLLEIPAIRVEYIFDPDPQAPGMLLGREHGIICSTDTSYPELKSNPGINLILEVTGKNDVFQTLGMIKHPSTSLIGAAGNKIVFSLLDTQNKAKEKLEAYKQSLERRIARRTRQLEVVNLRLMEQVREYGILNEKLQQINDQKTRYLLQSTHQLKAPFAAIQSYTDILLGGYAGEIPPKSRDIVTKMKERCELLSVSIKEMLELANLKTCVTDNIQMADADLCEILQGVIGKATILAEQSNIRMALAPCPEDIVHCNRNQISILFSILVENAINYSPEKTSIDVAMKKRRKSITVSIKDQGIGIREDSIPKIFNEYYRSNEAVAKHPNGTGLGLAIAAEIARIHNAGIRIKSRVGRGTTFFVDLPLDPVRPSKRKSATRSEP